MSNEIILSTATGTAYAIVGWVDDIRKRTWDDARSDKYRAMGGPQQAGFEIHAPGERPVTYFLREKAKFRVIPGATVYVIYDSRDVDHTWCPDDAPRTAQPPDADAPLFDFMTTRTFRSHVRSFRNRRGGPGPWM